MTPATGDGGSMQPATMLCRCAPAIVIELTVSLFANPLVATGSSPGYHGPLDRTLATLEDFLSLGSLPSPRILVT